MTAARRSSIGSAALGRDLTKRIVGTLSREAAETLDRALTPAFARRLAALAKERAASERSSSAS